MSESWSLPRTPRRWSSCTCRRVPRWRAFGEWASFLWNWAEPFRSAPAVGWGEWWHETDGWALNGRAKERKGLIRINAWLEFLVIFNFFAPGQWKKKVWILCKKCIKMQRKRWSNVPSKLLACIGLINEVKVVHKIGHVWKFNLAQEKGFKSVKRSIYLHETWNNYLSCAWIKSLTSDL